MQDGPKKGKAYGAVGVQDGASAPIDLPPGFPFSTIISPYVKLKTNAFEGRGREQRNRGITSQLAKAGIRADVIGSHQDYFNPETEELLDIPVMLRRGRLEEESSGSSVPQAIKAVADQPDAAENIVLAACRHSKYTPEECRALQSIADTSRGGKGVNIVLPAGRNVEQTNANPLGRIGATAEQYYDTEGVPIPMRTRPRPGGAMMFRPNAAPIDTTFDSPERVVDFMPLIQSLLERGAR